MLHDAPSRCQPRTLVPGNPGRTAALALLLLVGMRGAAQAAPAQDALPPAVRYNIYLYGQAAGTLKCSFSQVEFEGKPAVLKVSDLSLRLNAAGEVEEKMRTEKYLTQSGDPLLVRAVHTAARSSHTITARFFTDRIEGELEAEGQKKARRVAIPAGTTPAGDEDFRRFRSGVGPDYRDTASYFDHEEGAFGTVTMSAVGSEQLKGGDRAFDTIVLSTGPNGGRERRDWVTPDGVMLQEEIKSLGVLVVRDDLQPPVSSGAVPVDLMEAAKVKTARTLSDPRRVYRLKVKLTGIPDAALILSDARQRALVEVLNGAPTVTYDLRADYPPNSGAPRVQGPSDDPMLRDAPYLNVDDPAVRQLAQEIVGEETDRVAAALKIRDWVRSQMQYGNAGTYRAATEILKSRKGVCREYATLFAALARAAGIPTRLCGGLIYQNGAFYFHAWNECRVTDESDGWCRFDALVSSDFVDATHLKLGQGDVTDMYEFSRAVGLLQAEIIDYR